MEIIAVSWLISGLLCGIIGFLIAKNKNVDELAGILLGFFLGPIGLIIVALLSPKPARVGLAPVVQSRPKGAQDVSNDAYRIWLVSKYRVTKNDALGSFVVEDRLFPTVDEALDYAAGLDLASEDKRRASASAREDDETSRHRLQQERTAERRATVNRVLPWAASALVGTALLGAGAIFAADFQNKSKISNLRKHIDSETVDWGLITYPNLYSNPRAFPPAKFVNSPLTTTVACRQHVLHPDGIGNWVVQTPRVLEIRTNDSASDILGHYRTSLAAAGYQEISERLDPILGTDNVSVFASAARDKHVIVQVHEADAEVRHAYICFGSAMSWVPARP